MGQPLSLAGNAGFVINIKRMVGSKAALQHVWLPAGDFATGSRAINGG
jgi:hypothetical protein